MIAPVTRRSCRIVDCKRPRHYVTGYCNPHQYRHQRYGDALAGVPVRVTEKDLVCLVAGCEDGYYCHGYCAFHYRRWKRTGDVGDPQKRQLRPLRTPGGAHKRIYGLWGSASQYLCIECGRQANEWAYDGTDPSQHYIAQSNTGQWTFFSSWPEFYMPMCRLCHRLRDGRIRAQELHEYRLWRHTTGLILADLA